MQIVREGVAKYALTHAHAQLLSGDKPRSKLVKAMEEERDFRLEARLLNKYKAVHVVDLLEDITEKMGVLFLKIADMEEDWVEEESVIATVALFVNETLTKLSDAKKMFDKVFPNGLPIARENLDSE